MARFLGQGGNYITHKPKDILVFNRFIGSDSLPEAYTKYLKLYREACRRLPFIVQASSMHHMIHPTKAKLNLGTHMRKNSYVRSIPTLDRLTTQGYEWLQESAWMYNHAHNFSAYILYPSGDHTGYSYLDEKRYGGCSDFLKNFLTGAGRANY